MAMIPQVVMESTQAGHLLRCVGDWTVTAINALPAQFLPTDVAGLPLKSLLVDVSGVTKLDTVGAFRLQQLMVRQSQSAITVKLSGLSQEHALIWQLVEDNFPQVLSPKSVTDHPNFLEKLGRWVTQKWVNTLQFFAFIGEVAWHLGKMRRRAFQALWASGLKAIQTAGCQALPIIALMSFLVGVVLAYQLGVELQAYGADIYVVDATGIAIFREFAPLMASVVVAARTSTAFAALIGTMKVNEEIDALSTMGLSPIQRLVLPRVLAVLVSLPLLVVWGGIFSVFGSMVMAKYQMNISYLAYLQRFEQAVEVKQYVLGLIKTPVFALIIALVGCFQGFQSGLTADSVGLKTTAAAVQAIFLIIITDAFFSVVYSWQGL